MRTRRSLQLAVAATVALLAAGTTFAWAGVLVGGHRADRIGTFEPGAYRLVPADPLPTSGSTVMSRPKTTTASLEPTISIAPGPTRATTSSGPATEPTTAVSATTREHSDDSTSPTTGDNGRSNDD